MKIEYDKESGALYFRLREGKPDHAEDLSEKADVYAHVDSEGNVLGLGALSLEDLTQALGSARASWRSRTADRREGGVGRTSCERMSTLTAGG